MEPGSYKKIKSPEREAYGGTADSKGPYRIPKKFGALYGLFIWKKEKGVMIQ